MVYLAMLSCQNQTTMLMRHKQIILLFFGFDRNDKKLLKITKRNRIEPVSPTWAPLLNVSSIYAPQLQHVEDKLRSDMRCHILNTFTHRIVVSRPRHTQHVSIFIKFHTQLPNSALYRNTGHPGTQHTHRMLINHLS